jgi:hypothetical protein
VQDDATDKGEALIKIKWNDVIKKEARGIDNADLGEVHTVESDNVVTEIGFKEHDRFYLPKSLAERFDGKTLWFKITEEEANSKYRKD